MRIQWYYNQFQVTTVVGIPGILLNKRVNVSVKHLMHRNLPDPLYEQIKQLEKQLEKAKNGEIKDDYII